MISRPSASLSVTMASATSRSIPADVSTNSPSILPPSAAFARPGPIEAATSATVTGCSYCRTEPSGRRIETIAFSVVPTGGGTYNQAKKPKKMRPHFRGAAFTFPANYIGESGPRLASLRSGFGQRSRCHNRIRLLRQRRLLQFAKPRQNRNFSFVGRLDWTRTNDPHHVKVVL